MKNITLFFALFTGMIMICLSLSVITGWAYIFDYGIADPETMILLSLLVTAFSTFSILIFLITNKRGGK